MSCKTKYKFVLSARGKRFFKGANKKPMKKPLNKTFTSKKAADNYLASTLGSASESLYNLKKIKK